VASGTTGWLASHPEAEAAVNSAGENAIRTYFGSHADQWQQLQGIANPLRSLRNSCPQQVSAGDVARLFEAMSARVSIYLASFMSSQSAGSETSSS
jgi:heme-binding protein